VTIARVSAQASAVPAAPRARPRPPPRRRAAGRGGRARAHGGAHGELALAPRRAHERQPRGVDHGDDQHHGHGGEQQEQRVAHAAHERLLQGLDAEVAPELRVHARREVALPGADHDRLRLGRGLLRRDPGRQAPDELEPPRPPVVDEARGVDHRGRPHRHAGGEAEVGRHHAHHLVAHPVEDERLADGARVGAEALAPEGVAEHGHGRRAGAGVVGAEGAADGGAGAERGEQVAGRGRARDAQRHRRAGARRDEGARVGGVGDARDGREAARAGAHAVVERVGHRAVPHAHQPRGVAVRERPQEHAVDHAEERRGGADA
jgi:hypothetical protein